MEEVCTTTTKRSTMMNEFLNARAGRVYAKGRLATRETEKGVDLIAYGESILARISHDGQRVTLFTGHHGNVSQTVTRYVKILGRVLSNTPGKEVTVMDGHAPTTGYGRASEAGQYINSYFSVLSNDRSNVEQSAVEDVERSVQRRMNQLLG